jgi:hypothetical protein
MSFLKLLWPLSLRSAPSAESDDLWERIEAFSFDDNRSTLGFTARLANEQGWTDALAQRAIAEYKRFMYLTVVAGHKVTPSYTVDEVWHLHLLYTRSYWEEFCMGILGRLIHHDPAGTKAEESALRRQYERTLESYRSFFGEPPADIWGPDNGNNVKPRGH